MNKKKTNLLNWNWKCNWFYIFTFIESYICRVFFGWEEKKDSIDEFFMYYKHESKFAKRPKKYAHERFKGKSM